MKNGGGGGTFRESEWSFSGPNAWDGKSSNPIDGMPIGTFYTSGPDMIISGVFDGTLTNGRPKGVELYVVKDISDLSFYSIGSANNGGGSDGAEFPLYGTALAGSYIYVIASNNDSEFRNFFGFTPTKVFQTGHMLINGNDAIELFKSSEGQPMVIDTYGVTTKDGKGTNWNYMDGWAYRKNGGGGTFCTSIFSITNISI